MYNGFSMDLFLFILQLQQVLHLAFQNLADAVRDNQVHIVLRGLTVLVPQEPSIRNAYPSFKLGSAHAVCQSCGRAA